MVTVTRNATDTRPLMMKRPARHRQKAPLWLVLTIGLAAAWLIIMAVAALALDFSDGIDKAVASVTKSSAERSEASVPAQLTSPPKTGPTTTTRTETTTLPGAVTTITRIIAGRTVTEVAPGSVSTVTETAPGATVTVTSTAPGPTSTVTVPGPTSTVTSTVTQTVTCTPVIDC